MEVGIHKGRGEGPEGTLLIYDHLGEYTLSKKPGGIPAYTAQYTTVYRLYIRLMYYFFTHCRLWYNMIISTHLARVCSR